MKDPYGVDWLVPYDMLLPTVWGPWTRESLTSPCRLKTSSAARDELMRNMSMVGLSAAADC